MESSTSDSQGKPVMKDSAYALIAATSFIRISGGK
jgi:hypothetical protein